MLAYYYYKLKMAATILVMVCNITSILQAWCVCYNDSGTRVASVSDDKSLLIYNCPL